MTTLVANITTITSVPKITTLTFATTVTSITKVTYTSIPLLQLVSKHCADISYLFFSLGGVFGIIGNWSSTP
jgi:hypothetical protein